MLSGLVEESHTVESERENVVMMMMKLGTEHRRRRRKNGWKKLFVIWFRKDFSFSSFSMFYYYDYWKLFYFLPPFGAVESRLHTIYVYTRESGIHLKKALFTVKKHDGMEWIRLQFHNCCDYAGQQVSSTRARLNIKSEKSFFDYFINFNYSICVQITQFPILVPMLDLPPPWMSCVIVARRYLWCNL